MKKSIKNHSLQFNMPSGYWIALGVAFGLLYGMMLDNLGISVIGGIAVGSATAAWTLTKKRLESFNKKNRK